jgi:hypothetical protein
MTEETSVLTPEKHRRILEDIVHVCERAGVTTELLKTSAKPWVTPELLEWLVNFPEHLERGEGFLLVGDVPHGPLRVMRAATCALLRNYIDARVVLLNTVLSDKEGSIDPTVLMIPNVFQKTAGKSLPDWQVQDLYDLLLHRQSRNRPTCVYVESMAAMESAYGKLFAQNLQDNYYRAN